MKLFKFLLLLTIATAIFSASIERGRKVKSKTKALLPYKILVLGDIGQIDQFSKKAINSMNDALDDTKYVYNTNQKCKATPLTMTNFQSVIDDIQNTFNANEIQETVILGDAIYTEAKNVVGVVKQITSKAFNNDLTNGPVWTKDDRDDLIEKYLNEFHHRLRCGWKNLKKNVIKSDAAPLHPFIKEKTTIIFGNHSFDVNYDLELEFISNFLPEDAITVSKETHLVKEDKKFKHNFSFFGFKRKTKRVKSISIAQKEAKKDGLFQPRLTRGNGIKDTDGNDTTTMAANVYFLDIDMSKLVCADDIEDGRLAYEACISDRRYNQYPDLSYENRSIYYRKQKYAEMKEYYEQTKIILKDMANITKDSWKVVRIHQPIFNLERDYYGVKNNKRLMELFKLAGIHLWFVSHHHTAEVNLARYENDYYRYLIREDPVGDRLEFQQALSASNVNSVINAGPNDPFCWEDAKYDYWYKNNKNKKEKGFYKNSINDTAPRCVNRCKKALKECVNNGKEGTIYIKKNNDDMIIQLLSGNGGRRLDPLLSDRFSDSYLLYGKAVNDEYGFYTAEFTETTAKIVFRSAGREDFILNVVQDDLRAFDKDNFLSNFKFTKALKNKYTIYPKAG